MTEVNANKLDYTETVVFALNQSLIKNNPILDTILRIIDTDWDKFDDFQRNLILTKIKDVRKDKVSPFTYERVVRISKR